MARERGRDAYGLFPDYRACFCTPGGKCITSGKYQYDSDAGRVCQYCEGFGSPHAVVVQPLPEPKHLPAQIAMRFEDAS